MKIRVKRCLSFLVRFVFFSGSCVYFKLFHFNGNENNLFNATKVKLLNWEPDKNANFAS